ncbi:MAG: leucyl aminopeptidase, partial [Candidatus Micrarchaeota archaeon]|nr:leucyl aminopeptidase [Candidatus Micrarchaeota archaeon]
MKLSVQPSARAEGTVLPFWSPADSKGKFQSPKWAAALLAAGEFSGKSGQMSLLRLPPSLRGKNGAPHSRAVLFLGLGEPSKNTSHSVVGAYASAFNVLKGAQCATIALALPAPAQSFAFSSLDLCGRIASQVVMADYAFDKYKPKDPKAKEKPSIKEVVLVPPAASGAGRASPSASHSLPLLRANASRGVLLGEAANACRSIQNEPANIATPKYVAGEAKKLAKKNGLTFKVLGRPALQKQKMNAMLAVASGSMHEPQLILLEYRGNKSSKKWDVALVGKGVCFDSGGISIKPAAKMDEMKFDKSGACAVIGALSACKALQLRLNVVGVAAMVENMPGGHAYRPGDILTACNGVTMEILNTDAEGRVVLSDALAYASKTYQPAAMLDIATLTGACVVALGDLASGVLTEDEHLCSALLEAGEKSGERLWRLPLWPEYDEKVKSEVATVKNIGEPGSAGITAGASFLKPFVGETAWAHLDVAGTANSSRPKA